MARITKLIPLVTIVALSIALSLPMYGQTPATWTGGGVAGSYNDPDNWDTPDVPLNNGTTYDVSIAGGSVVFDVPEGAHELTNLALTNMRDFSISGNRSLTVTDDFSASISTNLLGSVAVDAGASLISEGLGTVQIDGGRFRATGGGTIQFLNGPVTFFMASGLAFHPTFDITEVLSASGAGSSINLSSVESALYFGNVASYARPVVIAEQSGQIDLSGLQFLSAFSLNLYQSALTFQVKTGGTIDLTNLTEVNSPSGPGPSLGFTEFDVGVTNFSLPALTTTRYTSFLVNSGASIQAPLLADLIGGTIAVEDTGEFQIGGDLTLSTNTADSVNSTVEVKGTGKIALGGDLIIEPGSVLYGDGTIEGNVINRSTVFVTSPALPSGGVLTVDGNYTQNNGGTLFIRLGGTTKGNLYSALNITDHLEAGGNLKVSLVGDFVPEVDDQFDILDFATASGSFTLMLPELPPALDWDDSDVLNTGVLTVISSMMMDDGDYNGNGEIDAADYTAWRDALTAGSTSLLNDPTPGSVDESDFLYWRDHFGETFGSGAGADANAAAPEPSSMWLVIASAILLSNGVMARRLRGQEAG